MVAKLWKAKFTELHYFCQMSLQNDRDVGHNGGTLVAGLVGSVS